MRERERERDFQFCDFSPTFSKENILLGQNLAYKLNVGCSITRSSVLVIYCSAANHPEPQPFVISQHLWVRNLAGRSWGFWLRASGRSLPVKPSVQLRSCQGSIGVGESTSKLSSPLLASPQAACLNVLVIRKMEVMTTVMMVVTITMTERTGRAGQGKQEKRESPN